MPLDDNERKILAEIERQFHEEDPDLARAVGTISRPRRVGTRVAAVGAVLGLAIVIAFVTVNTAVAFAGFSVMVLSIVAMVGGYQARQEAGDDDPVARSESDI